MIDHIDRFDVTSRRRLIKGVKEQIRINREEEKQRLLEEKNINDDHRKMLKMAAGLTTKVSFHSGSPRSSSPSVTEEPPVDETATSTSRRPSNLTRANVKAAAAAAERKAQQTPGRKVSITGVNSKGKVAAGSSVDRLNVDDDDDDEDPDMMSLDNSMMSSVGFHSERSRRNNDLNAIANNALKTNHGRK